MVTDLDSVAERVREAALSDRGKRYHDNNWLKVLSDPNMVELVELNPALAKIFFTIGFNRGLRGEML